MDILDFLYFFVPVFGFAALVEMLHFLPFLRWITEKRVYERMYSAMVVFLIAFLVFEAAFLVDLYHGSKALHQVLEIAAMSIVLLETVIVVRRSVTELQVVSVTKEVLERSEKKYRSLIETMNDGFWTLDENLITTMVNNKMGKMLGYSMEEMVGKSVMFFLDKGAQAEVKKQNKLRPKGISSTYEVEITKKDGTKLPVLVSASPIFDEKGNFKGSFAVVTNISKLKEMQKEINGYSKNLEKMVEGRTRELTLARDSLVNMLEDLTESKKQLEVGYGELKDVDRVKTDIISNVSHELRTPITIAKSSIELMDEEDTKEQKKLLAMCENALSRLNEMVENLVNISVIYKGRFVPAREPVDITTAIKAVLQNLTAVAKEKEIELKYMPKDDLPKAKGDKKAIEGVLFSLIDNAIKFNKKGGKVEVKAEKKEGVVQISVKDTGIGIAPEDKERIFEPFFQLDSSTTREYGGTGIGLTLIKAHVEAQKGRVWVESVPGKGSTFFFTLPAVQVKS